MLRLVSALLLTAASALQAAPVPYTADASTVYLWHLDEASGSTAAGLGSATNASLISYDGNPANNNATSAQAAVSSLLGSAGFTGFGNAANVSAADFGLGLVAFS